MVSEWRNVERQAKQTLARGTEIATLHDQQTVMASAMSDQQTLAGHDETSAGTDNRTRLAPQTRPVEVARRTDEPVGADTSVGNPVVNRLLEQAAARYGRDAISFVSADEFVREEPTDSSAPLAAPQDKPGPRTTATGRGILRSMALKLVEQEVLQERRAVSISPWRGFKAGKRVIKTHLLLALRPGTPTSTSLGDWLSVSTLLSILHRLRGPLATASASPRPRRARRRRCTCASARAASRRTPSSPRPRPPRRR